MVTLSSSASVRTMQPRTSSVMKEVKNGYEPSDTEAEWDDSPWNDRGENNTQLNPTGLNVIQLQARNKSTSLRLNQRKGGKSELEGVSSIPVRSSKTSPPKGRQNISTYALHRDDGNVHSPAFHRRHPSTKTVSPFSRSEQRRNASHEPEIDDGFRSKLRHLSTKTVSPLSRSEQRRNASHEPKTVSPFSRSEQRRNASHEPEIDDGFHSKLIQAYNDVNVTKVNNASPYIQRSASAPRQTFKERDIIKKETYWEQNKAERKVSPFERSSSRKERDGHHKRSPSGGEINEMLANVMISKAPTSQPPNFESTDSIAAGDIFFSREYCALTKQKNLFVANGGTETKFTENPEFLPKTYSGSRQRYQINSLLNQDIREVSATVSTESTAQTNVASSKYTVSRHSSTLSDFSGRTNGTARKFTMNRRKSQTDAWFSCIKQGSCRGTKSPEKERNSYEATVIEKAFVVESLRQFWADKHRPGSLTGFTCHKQQALLLKRLATDEIPHILLKGPPGSGKKSLIMALLREIYGDTVLHISHDLRYFHIKEKPPMEVVVPISSSPHHLELNVSLEPNAMYALMALVKQISADYAVIREVSRINAKADYKAMVLYDVDKAPGNIQHLIKWILDCYSDACKLILCCENDVDILESVKSRCKVIDIEAPDIHEIRKVLVQIAEKEDFELSMSFATRVANKSKGNLRRAIMALEACKTNNYPFVGDQPIPLGWEEVLVELAAGILADPSTNRLFLVRAELQTLLADFVHPKLILMKLVEQFVKGVSASSRREVYYWHSYYDKRLPPGTTALLKLEEFTAKFMSIHRRNLNPH